MPASPHTPFPPCLTPSILCRCWPRGGLRGGAAERRGTAMVSSLLSTPPPSPALKGNRRLTGWDSASIFSLASPIFIFFPLALFFWGGGDWPINIFAFDLHLWGRGGGVKRGSFSNPHSLLGRQRLEPLGAAAGGVPHDGLRPDPPEARPSPGTVL